METEPLLAHGDSSSHASEQDGQLKSPERSQSTRLFIFYIFALEFCIKFVMTLLELPLIRLVERMVCRRYINAGSNDVDEASCKIPQVQNRVAFIIGIKTTLDALPCLLTVLVYGNLSNGWGRRPLIMLQSTGRLLALVWIVVIELLGKKAPAELIWISSLFLFIGGGAEAELSIIYTSFCDAVGEEKRTQLLTFIHASEGFAGVLALSISSQLMELHLWSPFALAISINLLEYVIVCYVPETSSFTIQNPGPLPARSQSFSTSTDTLWLSMKVKANDVKQARFWSLIKHRGLKVIFASFIIKRIAFVSERFVSQYISEILHRRIFESFWLQACANIGMVIVLCILIPLFTHHMKTPSKDLWIIRCSLVVIMIGFTVLWCSRSILALCLGLIACGLGEGLDVGLQSLGSYIVGKSRHEAFFSLSAMLGVAGELLGGPLMAGMYSIRDHSGGPLGYCFLLSTILFVSLFIGSCFITTTRLHQSSS